MEERDELIRNHLIKEAEKREISAEENKEKMTALATKAQYFYYMPENHPLYNDYEKAKKDYEYDSFVQQIIERQTKYWKVDIGTYCFAGLTKVTMRCSNCGNIEIEEEDRFCGRCGSTLIFDEKPKGIMAYINGMKFYAERELITFDELLSNLKEYTKHNFEITNDLEEIFVMRNGELERIKKDEVLYLSRGDRINFLLCLSVVNEKLLVKELKDKEIDNHG